MGNQGYMRPLPTHLYQPPTAPQERKVDSELVIGKLAQQNQQVFGVL